MADKKTEQIGKINLDLTFYPGEDFYCDGAVEDELLDIARNYSQVEYQKIIEERRSWEILYHLSSQRENIVEWLPITQNMKVLEVGSGCGAITGALSEKAGEVTCIDLSKKRSMINAYRHMDCDNVTIHVGNFQDIEPSLPNDYDYICLIGVFEYAQAYIGSDRPFEGFLEILKKHMKKDGHIAIAIENKFGLKYFAGCMEDHLGTYFSGLENYPDGGVVRTFTRNGLERILANCGVQEYSFYYPYPDYKFMTTVFSDDHLPQIGELSNNARNFDRDRMVLFNEKKVFDGIIRDGLFPEYSNSYMLIIGSDLNVKYAKYSNDRQPEYQIRTEIVAENLMGYQEKGTLTKDKLQLVVRKHPLSIQANEHIRNIETAYGKLKERYTGGEIKVNRCKLVDVGAQLHDTTTTEQLLQGKTVVQKIKPYVELEYIYGVTLAELLDHALEKDNMEEFLRLFRRYLEILDYHSEMPVADFDLIFSNILLSEKNPSKPFDPIENANWTMIDYEWTFGKKIDTKELAFRAIYCYILEDEKRNKLKLDLIFNELGITDKDAEEYREQEVKFQSFVTGNRRSMREMRDLIGHRCFEPVSWIERIIKIENKARVQIYEDKGNGFAEDTSYHIQGYQDAEKGVCIPLPVEKNMRNVRIDPCCEPCIIELKDVRYNDVSLDLDGKDSIVSTSGTRLDKTHTFVFAHNDPNFTVALDRLPSSEKGLVEFEYQLSFLDAGVAANIENAALRRFRL